MKLSTSRIVEINEDYKPLNEIIERVRNSQKDFVQYELVEGETKGNKLAYRNSNHREMFSKHLMFEHFYVIAPILIVVFFLSVFSNSVIMISLAVIGLFYIPYKLIAISEVPHQLIFEGLNIYEVNWLNKRIKELYSTEIGSTEDLSEDFLFITSKKRKKEKMKILIIKKADIDSKDFQMLSNHFKKFNSKTKFK